MSVPFKKDPVEYNQRLLFPSNIFDLLPENHECFVYKDIFKELDTKKVEQNYSVRGQNAYHPKLIIGILIYAYSQGVFSSRQIEKKCHEDLGFMFISHMNCPNFRVLSNFRKDNYDFFKECFKQTVLLAMAVGMVSLGHISLDGSKFKANTSKHKAMSYKRLQEKEKQLTAEIEELLAQGERCDEEEDEEYGDKTGNEISEELKFKETRLEKIKTAKEALEKREQELNPGKKIDGKKQISFADEEARIMGKKGNFEYSYNGQISVDEKYQIILGEHLTQNANDKKEVKTALEEIEETTGSLPEKMSTDNGYLSGENLEAFENTGIDTYIATGKEGRKDERPISESNRKITKPDFTYDEQQDVFMCPQGHVLGLKKEGSDGKKVYQAPRDACSNCHYKDRCCKSTKGEPRTVTADDMEPLRKAMVEKMELESSKDVYKRRKVIVEPVFGQIKNGGFRGFSMRGVEKVRGEFSLICAVHNLKKIVRRVLEGVVRLESLKLAQMNI